MIEKRKAKAIAVKQLRARGEINLSNDKKDESDTGNNTNSDQANDIYSLQL